MAQEQLLIRHTIPLKPIQEDATVLNTTHNSLPFSLSRRSRRGNEGKCVWQDYKTLSRMNIKEFRLKITFTPELPIQKRGWSRSWGTEGLPIAQELSCVCRSSQNLACCCSLCFRLCCTCSLEHDQVWWPKLCGSVRLFPALLCSLEIVNLKQYSVQKWQLHRGFGLEMLWMKGKRKEFLLLLLTFTVEAGIWQEAELHSVQDLVWR